MGKDATKHSYSYIFLFVKDYQTIVSGWPGAQCLRTYGGELVSKPAKLFEKS